MSDVTRFAVAFLVCVSGCTLTGTGQKGRTQVAPATDRAETATAKNRWDRYSPVCLYLKDYHETLRLVAEQDPRTLQEVTKLLPEIIRQEKKNYPLPVGKFPSYNQVMAVSLYEAEERKFDFLNALSPQDREFMLRYYMTLTQSRVPERENYFNEALIAYCSKHPEIDVSQFSIVAKPGLQ